MLRRSPFRRSCWRKQAEPEVQRLIAGERRLFDLRRTARDGQKAQLAERIAQLRQEIEGLEGQIVAKGRESELIGNELEGTRTLWKKNLVPIDRLSALERNAARLDGERGALVAASAQTKGKITETELQIIQVDQELRSEVARELADIRQKSTELMERKTGAEDQLKRIDIRAPQIGRGARTHRAHGRRGDRAGRADHADRAGSRHARRRGADLARRRRSAPCRPAGAAALLRLQPRRDAGSQRRGVGRLGRRPARRAHRRGLLYRAHPRFRRASGGGSARVKLVPGMPVEVFLATAPRTVVSYLVKPLHDQVAKAFRD